MTITLEQLAHKIGAQLRGDGSQTVIGCASLEEAGPEHVSFLANRKYANQLAASRAGAIIVCPDDADQADDRTLLVADDPYFAFRQAMVELHGWRQQPVPGISELAYIDPSAVIGELCTIRPFAYIAPRATIGKRCIIYPQCYVGKDSVIGDDCVIYPNVTIYAGCVLGDRVTVHAGCVIGQDGFGYATHNGKHHKIPSAGNVVIEDDVELGANCAIDRATVGSTVIGKGTKLSDLIAIGHGTTVGQHNLLVAQVGLAGSTRTGDYVAMGGQVGVAGHLTIADHVQLAGKTAVITDIPDKGQYGGIPAVPLQQAKRNALATSELPGLIQDSQRIKKRLEKLEALLHDRLTPD
ncbi:MAG: UDP-3-O-(3-hydroxymyristoyl)glucosamine N-acyltransferase, partial [Phycisphaeraceae bacterium]